MGNMTLSGIPREEDLNLRIVWIRWTLGGDLHSVD